MNRNRNRLIRGFVLIEAMIALVVLSFGIISIAKLQSELLASSGYTKARAEAVQLADQQMEALRNLIVEGDFTALTTGSDAVAGTNAAFTRTWTVGPVVDGRRTVTLTVTWNDAREGLQTITLQSFIAWDDPATGVALISDDEEPPGGRVTLNLYEPPPVDAFVGGPPADSVDKGDGFYEYVDDTGRYLLDEDGNILDYSSDGRAYSYIAGSVYVDRAKLPSQDMSKVNISFTGARGSTADDEQCRKIATDVLPVGASDANVKYDYFTYRCAVKAGWDGKVGAYISGGAGAGDRFCMGDPGVATSLSPFSRHPVLARNRQYLSDVHTGISPEQNLAEHNFLLTNIPGQPGDSDCTPRMEQTVPSPFKAGIFADSRGGVNYSAVHPGRHFCLMAECAGAGDDETVPETTISGSIGRLKVGGNLPRVTEMAVTGGSCVVTTPSTNADHTYMCTINWSGWGADTWTGTVTVTTNLGDRLCANSVAVTADYPLEPAVNTTAKTITFTDIDPSLTQMTLIFDIAYQTYEGTCTTSP